MNIFFVNSDPIVAAQSLVDRHCVKMILESAQLLSTAHRYLDGFEILGKSKTGRNAKRWILDDSRENVLYQATHINHPSAIWSRNSIENYNWLVEHFFALGDEYTYRYGKTHKCFGELSSILKSTPNKLTKNGVTTMPCAMPSEYIISEDPIVNYRNYYMNGKKNLHKWTKRFPPIWLS